MIIVKLCEKINLHVTMDWWIFSFLFSFFIIFGWFVRRRYNYWYRHKISYVRPIFPIGSLKVFLRKHMSQCLASLYRQRKHDTPMLGMYIVLSPVLMISNLDLIRHIIIEDFEYFQDRGAYYNEKNDPLSANLSSLENDKWRALRHKLMPLFTSDKMRFMFGTILDVANEFIDCLDVAICSDNQIDMNEWLNRFTSDVLGSCAFGIECNSLTDPREKFRQMGKKAFDQPTFGIFKWLLIQMSERAAKFLGVRYHRKDVSDFFLSIVKETIAHREANNVQRNDFMSLLIDMKNATNCDEQLTIHEIAAQAFIFFFIGFERSTLTLTYCLYELALHKNKHIQDEARCEILSTLDKYDGNLTYEAIHEMTYIDQIINEALRKHPPSPILSRVATQNYKVPNSRYTIPKGMAVLIPSYAIHHDPDFYENPNQFEPKRFAPDEMKTRPSCSFLPFGEGPRNCIGLRFGMLQARIGLVKLLQKFEFSTCLRTPIPIKYKLNKVILTPENGMWLKVRKLP